MTLKNKLLNRTYSWLSGAILIGLLTACSIDSVLETDVQEEGREVDPSLVVTRAGGIALYNRALQDLQSSVRSVSLNVGLMSDELAAGRESDNSHKGMDARQSGRDVDGRSYGVMMNNFAELQSVRISAGQAISILKSLNDPSMNGLIAAAYAFQGYSLLLLAENYCSGVPLTEIPFDGDVVYGNAQSTSQVLAVAVSKFDSALAISHDSTKIVSLARIGKSRSLMSLGNYKEAAEVVGDVLPGEVFYLSYTITPPPGSSSSSHAFWPDWYKNATPEEALQILNEEGDNGMRWYDDPNDIDPRVPVSTVISDGNRVFPENVVQKKFESGTLRFPLARGIEAMLIRAEYALKEGDAEWLDPINQARATIGLAALADPGDQVSRVDLLFKERARWFYLEGFRLADFRRLVRQYGRSPYAVYPIGLYTQSRGEIPFYGDAWVFGVPKDEYVNNYRYQGCLSWNP